MNPNSEEWSVVLTAAKLPVWPSPSPLTKYMLWLTHSMMTEGMVNSVPTKRYGRRLPQFSWQRSL